MNSERAKFYALQQPFIQILLLVLGNERALPQLHLECIMFVSSLVLYSAAAQGLGKHGIVDLLVKDFFWHADDLDVQSQCMFAFFRLVCHGDTRAALLAKREVIDTILKHSTSKNAVLNGIAHSVLDAIVTFDKQSAERLKLPRFDAFNQEWLAAITNPDPTTDS
jgi:hypothetical protein